MQLFCVKPEDNQMVKVAKEHFGNIDIVINNALVNFKFDPNQQKNFKDLTCEDYQQQLDGTLKAAFNVTQSVIPQFTETQCPTMATSTRPSNGTVMLETMEGSAMLSI